MIVLPDIFLVKLSTFFIGLGFDDVQLLKFGVISFLALTISWIWAKLENEKRFKESILIFDQQATEEQKSSDDYYSYVREFNGIRLLASSVQDSPLDFLLISCMMNQQSIMLHMNDKKVYVGLLSSSTEPNEAQGANQEISLSPTWSGYRENDTLKVVRTTFYPEEINVEITLKQANIVSATIYDDKLFNDFNSSMDKLDEEEEISSHCS